MELKDFIKGTLVSILDGIDSANREKSSRFHIAGEGTTTKIKMVQSGTFVYFDVGVTATEIKDSKDKQGISIIVANLFAGLSNEQRQEYENKMIHHLRFKVFISQD